MLPSAQNQHYTADPHSGYSRPVRSVRIAIALYLILALPALVFGFLLEVAPLGLPCDASGGFINLINPLFRTSGEPCRTIDYTMLYWFIPAVTLVIIAVGIDSARRPAPRERIYPPA